MKTRTPADKAPENATDGDAELAMALLAGDPSAARAVWQRFSPHFDLTKEWVPRSYANRTGLELMLWWKRKAAAK